jgi:hypothetical protein
MRRLRYQVATSLDGYIAGPHGEFDWIVTDPEIDFAALVAQFDTAVMGRKTFLATQQRTWFGPITLERAVYAGPGCRVRAHRVPLDAAWGPLGAGPPAGVPDPDGGALAPAPPGGGPARLAPAFAALVVEFGARLPYAEAARLLALALGPAAGLAPNTVRAYTQAAGRARQEAEAAALKRSDNVTRRPAA